MWTRSFAAYVVARFFCMFSMQMQLLVLGLALYDLTSNPFFLGVAGLATFAPALALVFVSGLAADRFNRKIVMGLSFSVAAISGFTVVWLQSRGELTPIPIFLLLAMAGAARAFYNPTLKSLLVNLVPIEVVQRAIAFNTTTAKSAQITGPVVGGFLYAITPIAAYWAIGIGFVIAILATLFIGKTTQQRATKPFAIGDFIGGVRTILSSRLLFGAMTLDLVAIILGGATALLPVYGRDILMVGASEIGLLRAAPAIGTLLAAVLLIWRPLRSRAGLVMLSAMFGYGIAILVFGLSHVYWLSFLALCAAGVCDMISIFVRESLIQLRTPDTMRGRVNAINSVFNTGANELGDFRAGSMAALLGAVPAVAFGALCSMGIALLWSWRYPELRTMDRP
jgi:MFS family permease